jgi:hypothetical protein
MYRFVTREELENLRDKETNAKLIRFWGRIPPIVHGKLVSDDFFKRVVDLNCDGPIDCRTELLTYNEEFTNPSLLSSANWNEFMWFLKKEMFVYVRPEKTVIECVL